MDAPLSPAHERLGSALRKLRKDAGLSLEQLRLRAKSTSSYSTPTLSKVESGKYLNPTSEIVAFYVRHLGGDLNALERLRLAISNIELKDPDEADRERLLREFPMGFRVVQRARRVVIRDQRVTETTVSLEVQLVRLDDLRYIRFRYRVPEDPSATVNASAMLGCTLERQQPQNGGGVEVDLKLVTSQSAAVMDTMLVVYAISVQSRAPCEPSVFFEHGINAGDQAIEIDFGPAPPPRIWWFRGLPNQDRFVTPIASDNDLLSLPIVHKSFKDLRQHETYGLTWLSRP